MVYALLLCPHMAESQKNKMACVCVWGGGNLLGFFSLVFLWGTNFTHQRRVLILTTNHFQKAPLLYTVTLQIMCQQKLWKGHRYAGHGKRNKERYKLKENEVNSEDRTFWSRSQNSNCLTLHLSSWS